MIDAYTKTDDIPYSEPFPRGRFDYIRNAVKVVVDAYEGSVDFYVADETDPLVQFYRSSFPEVFKSMSKFQRICVHIFAIRKISLMFRLSCIVRIT